MRRNKSKKYEKTKEKGENTCFCKSTITMATTCPTNSKNTFAQLLFRVIHDLCTNSR